MPVGTSAQRTTFTAGFFDGLDDGPPPPLSVNADQRGAGAEYNGKLSFDISEAALQLMRANLSWAPLGQAAIVTFGFRAGASGMPSSVQGFVSFTEVQIQATLLALQSWSDVAGITFARQDNGSGYSDNATMLFGSYSSGMDGSAAFAYLPGSIAAASTAGDVWVNASLSYNALPAVWGYGQLTLVHEIGHALGLLHPGDYDSAPGVSITYAADAVYAEDSNQYTVMSYFRETATGASYGSGRYAAAPLLDDIAAAQRMYGANMTTRTGDTVYGFNSTADRAWFSASESQPTPVFAIWDAGGIDTLDFSGYGGAQLLDLRQGSFSNFGVLIGNVSIAVGAVIENAIGGAGNDVINGNSANNRITPGAGNNQVEGGLGTDTLVLAGARSAYTITMTGQQGFISGPEGTTQFRNVEFLSFSDGTIAAPQGTGGITVSGDMTNDTVDGGAFEDTLSGGGGNDLVRGFDGADRLIGGRGDDTIDGGAGNDQFYVDRGNDVIIGGDGALDMLHAEEALGGLSIDLQAGTISGGGMGVDSVSGIEWVIGSRFNDVIVGGAGDDRLEGYGGIDTLRGGDGNDELFASWAEGGGGADVIKSGQQANNAIASAVSLDASFDTLSRDGVHSPTTPHATIVATTHGGLEYYAFTVGANTDVSIDIDGATFDSTIQILDATGAVLASNDDGRYTGDGGLRTDSFLNFRLVAAGTYYVQVGKYADDPNSTEFAVVPPPADLSYTLHVTAPGHAVQPTHGQGSELHGDAGDDILRSSVCADVLDGGSGFDTAVFAGLRSSYTVSVSGGVTTVSNADGADTVTNVERLQFIDMRTDAAGVPEGQPVNGTAGADTMNGTGGDDVINGLGGDDSIFGNGGNDRLDGGSGDDLLNGGAGNDVLTGGEGSDMLQGGAGDDVYHVTAGDTVVEAENEGLDVVHSTGSHQLGANMEAVYLLGNGNYVGTGNNLSNWIYGGAGNDSLFGLRGNDVLDGGAGDDGLAGNEGDDWLRGGAGSDTLIGGEGADRLEGGAGNDVYHVDADDTVVEAGNEGLDIVYSTGSHQLGSNVEAAYLLGSGASVGTGNDLSNFIYGGSGNDSLFGLGGNDLLDGGAGNDGLAGNEGDDWLRGGAGNDTLLGYAGNDTLTGGEGSDAMQGGAGDDTYYVDAGDTVVEGENEGLDIVYSAGSHQLGLNFEAVYLQGTGAYVGVGNDLSNWIYGGAGDESLFGLRGNDLLDGGAGHDGLAGNEGVDWLRGGAGDDTLIGGADNDTLDGGAGADTAVYSGNRSAYTITVSGGVTTVSGSEGTDTLTNVERLQFADMVTGAAGQAATQLALASGPLALPAMGGDKTSDGPEVLPVTPDGDTAVTLFGQTVMNDDFLFELARNVDSSEAPPVMDDEFVMTGKFEGPTVMPSLDGDFDGVGRAQSMDFAGEPLHWRGHEPPLGPHVSNDGLTPFDGWLGVGPPTRSDVWE